MTNTRLSTVCALLALAFSLTAQAQEAVTGPRLQVDTREIDFGEIVQGAVVEHTVQLRNAGTEPLLITRATASCDCTVGKFPTEPIAPGEAGELVLVFDSTTKRGMQKFEILVYSNDPTQQDRSRFCTLLTLMGEVRSLYQARPGGAFFGEFVPGGEAVTRTITVVGRDEAKGGFSARIVGELPDYLRAEVQPWSKGSRKGVQVAVTLLPTVPRGEMSHVLQLETSVELQPKLQLPLIAIVTGKYHGPDFVQMLRVPRGTEVERRVPIERRDGETGFHVVGIDADERLLSVRQEPISAERLDLVMTLSAQAPPGVFATVVRVHIEDPAFPLLEIPVFGHVVAQVQLDPPALLLHPASKSPVPLTVRGGRVLGVRGPAGLIGEVVADGSDGPARIDVRIDLSQGKPPQQFMLVVETDVPGEGTVEVPVRLMPWD
jgi:hypothetical protein